MKFSSVFPANLLPVAIEPLWDWNDVPQDRYKVEDISRNRTIMGLKLFNSINLPRLVPCRNRTIMGLKPLLLLSLPREKMSRNRTIMGLKLPWPGRGASLFRLSQSNHYMGLKSQSSIPFQLSEPRRNRTIMGLKQVKPNWKLHRSDRRNRTIMGLKHSTIIFCNNT